MSWNPFSRHGTSKKSVVSKQAERELEREIKKLEQLDEATKKLYKDGKRYVEANNECGHKLTGICKLVYTQIRGLLGEPSDQALGKAEHKIVQNLVSSGVCQSEEQFQRNIDTWEKSLENLQRNRQELNSTTQKTLIEPMKKFSGVFPSAQTAIKKRDQSLQEYNKTQAKYSKYQERERTGQNVVKMDTNKRALDTAKEDFTSQDLALRQDLPRLYEGRMDYFKPTFDALVRSQLAYNSEAFKTYSEVSSEFFDNSKLSEKDRKSRINQTLTELKALSITVDD